MKDKSKALQKRYDRGTPETVKQQKRTGPGTIETLLSRGRIGSHEIQAADEIERVFRYQSAVVFSKTMRYAPRGDKGHSDGDPAWFKDAFIKRYKPWAAQRDPSISVVIDIAVFGYSGRDMDRWNGWPHRTAVNLLVKGLRDYAINAGWVDRNTMDDWRREEAA